jgi:hypothetical protein
MFGPVKEAFNRREFTSKDKSQDSVPVWLHSQRKVSLQMGSEGL